MNAAALLELATAVAREAGALLAGYAARELRTSFKSSPTDMVSEADIAVERLIRARLLAARPDDGILGEEGGDRAGTSGLRWVVDPLDGTTNLLYGIPIWCVSIAVEDATGVGVAGAVFDPTLDELWTAHADGPACRNGSEVRPSGTEELARALVATGFGYDAAVRARQAAIVSAVLPAVRDLRRCGSAALDLCWTAAGRYDAYFEFGVNHWDYAAGRLLCERAGLAARHLPAPAPAGPGLLVAAGPLADALEPLLR